MKLFVGVTNNDWFRFLSERKPDEVNFWRPRSQSNFNALSAGDVFHGQSLKVLPRRQDELPAPEFLKWHNGIFKS